MVLFKKQRFQEKNGIDYHTARILLRKPNHLGVTIQADIIKQNWPLTMVDLMPLVLVKNSSKVYSELTTDHPIDLCRYQVANCYMGRNGLINSGGLLPKRKATWQMQ